MSEPTTPSPTPALSATLEILKEIRADTKPISSTPQPVPATTTKLQPELPPHAPQFAPVKHPVLFAIHGKKHLIGPLKDLISADANLQDPYKALLHHELSFVKTNAAEIDLHVVKHENGDVSIQGHIKRIQLG
jgi:hypothetical protein